MTAPQNHEPYWATDRPRAEMAAELDLHADEPTADLEAIDAPAEENPARARGLWIAAALMAVACAALGAMVVSSTAAGQPAPMTTLPPSMVSHVAPAQPMLTLPPTTATTIPAPAVSRPAPARPKPRRTHPAPPPVTHTPTPSPVTPSPTPPTPSPSPTPSATTASPTPTGTTTTEPGQAPPGPA